MLVGAARAASWTALAFLTGVVKDHSGVKEAISLYEGCLKHVPASNSYALMPP